MSFERSKSDPPPRNCFELYLRFRHSNGNYTDTHVPLARNLLDIAKLYIIMCNMPMLPTDDEIPKQIFMVGGYDYWHYDIDRPLTRMRAELDCFHIYYYDERGLEYRVNIQE